MIAACCYCERTDKGELRPYGPKGEWVCFPCATKPENVANTEAQFANHLEQVAQYQLAKATDLGGVA